MDIAMPHTSCVGRSVQFVGQSRNARWMAWQDRRWTSINIQCAALADIATLIDTPSRSTVANWRNGELPGSDYLIDLIDAFPSLKRIFWREEQSGRAEQLLAKLDQMEADISNLRELL